MSLYNWPMALVLNKVLYCIKNIPCYSYLILCTENTKVGWLVISVIYRLYRLPIRATPPRRRLVVTGDSAGIQDETTENSAWFFKVLGVYHRHTGLCFKVSSEKLLVILVGQPGIRTHTL